MMAGSGRVGKRRELLFRSVNLLILQQLLWADTFSLSFVLLVSVSWRSAFPSGPVQNVALPTESKGELALGPGVLAFAK